MYVLYRDRRKKVYIENSRGTNRRESCNNLKPSSSGSPLCDSREIPGQCEKEWKGKWNAKSHVSLVITNGHHKLSSFLFPDSLSLSSLSHLWLPPSLILILPLTHSHTQSLSDFLLSWVSTLYTSRFKREYGQQVLSSTFYSTPTSHPYSHYFLLCTLNTTQHGQIHRHTQSQSSCILILKHHITQAKSKGSFRLDQMLKNLLTTLTTNYCFIRPTHE